MMEVHHNVLIGVQFTRLLLQYKAVFQNGHSEEEVDGVKGDDLNKKSFMPVEIRKEHEVVLKAYSD